MVVFKAAQVSTYTRVEGLAVVLTMALGKRGFNGYPGERGKGEISFLRISAFINRITLRVRLAFGHRRAIFHFLYVRPYRFYGRQSRDDVNTAG